MARTPRGPKQVASLKHEEAKRLNIPTAELQSTAEYMEEISPPPPAAYPRPRPLSNGETRPRDVDLDPQIVWNGVSITLTKDQAAQLAENGKVEIGDAQLVWRGKDRQDWSDLVVNVPPLYIQEKIHPKAIIDDLTRHSSAAREAASDAPNLFADFNGLTDPEARTEFYQHNLHWSNRMVLGDSLQVMASLAEREALRGQIQCIYFDPPYGIKFNSNWQVSTLSRDVKDGKQADISREPEQVQAFRDTWSDKIHSYLTYIRDRLMAAQELLTESGSIFVQIGEQNVHRVRAVMDEVFGERNYASTIYFSTTGGLATDGLSRIGDYVLWYFKNNELKKVRDLYQDKGGADSEGSAYTNIQIDLGVRRRLTPVERSDPALLDPSARIFRISDLCGQGVAKLPTPFSYEGVTYNPTKSSHWKTHYPDGLTRLARAERLYGTGQTLNYVRYFDDYPVSPYSNVWSDTGHSGFAYDKLYVVQTATKVVERCILMASDPGDLVLDPTCGSGTTAFVAEQWGRRWITLDTSRVALALARSRLMSARYPYYLLADSPEGRRKEAEVSGKLQTETSTHGDLRQGFVYERTPHVTLKAIANNAEIDVIWETWQATLQPLRAELNRLLHKSWEDWEIPRDISDLVGDESGFRKAVFEVAPSEVMRTHSAWWDARIARQKEIDASIARAADVEYLYDRPYSDNNRVRVAGPFTVESLSPHRVVPSDAAELLDEIDAAEGRRRRTRLSTPTTDFAQVVIEHLKTAGVQQAARGDKIDFTALTPWPGEYIGAEGRFMEGNSERRAGVFIGPEFGTLSRVDLTAAAREATEARFDALIACAFNFDAHASELVRLGPLPILKAKINPDLHMADELKNTGKGNLFIVFGEPDIELIDVGDGQIQVKVKGIDVFDPNTGEVRSNDVKGIAAWFIDTDYDHESFFVRHAYFLGANDPYKSLKIALKAEIDEDAWATLYRDTSRPFPRPSTGKIAVKVINHFGDEVMKVFGV